MTKIKLSGNMVEVPISKREDTTMFALILKVNGREIARQLHPTRDAALVASMDLVQSVRLELEIVELSKEDLTTIR